MLDGKIPGQFLQTVGASCGQQQICASSRQELRELEPDPSARAGDQRPLPGPSFQRVMCHTILPSICCQLGMKPQTKNLRKNYPRPAPIGGSELGLPVSQKLKVRS